MTLDRAVMAFAGCIVLVSLALAYLFSPYWLLLTTFAGAQSHSGVVHRLLSGRDRVQATRRRTGHGFQIGSGRRPRLDLDHGRGPRTGRKRQESEAWKGLEMDLAREDCMPRDCCSGRRDWRRSDGLRAS